MTQSVQRSLRLQIGIFGRTNVGKSSFLNYIASQEVAITSPVPGTTTDVVEKAMELLPVGPVVFLDTAGIDDTSLLAPERLKKTEKIFERADIAVLIVESDIWTAYEDRIVMRAQEKNIPCVVVINKIDLVQPSEQFLGHVQQKGLRYCLCSCTDQGRRDECINVFKQCVLENIPQDYLKPVSLLADLVPAGGMIVLVVPIDLEAPKGRLILPQVQTIRETLDNDSSVVVVKEREYASVLRRLNKGPDLVICDSQAVLKMVSDTPAGIPCTTFSILFARYKGILTEAVRSVVALDALHSGDKVLIAEACSHHPIADDIGRVKIPRWLRQYTGADISIDISAGRDFPEYVKQYDLVIQCGGCMITRRELMLRMQKAQQQQVPFTNYGVAISYVQGVLDRVLSPFPQMQEILRESRQEAVS